MSQRLATALLYGIKSDTRDLGREVSPDDVWAYSHLVPKTDMPTALRSIFEAYASSLPAARALVEPA